jgi:Glycosyl hydrolase family 53
MKIYLDIMYSDFWADPTKQNIPAAWQGQDLAQLSATVQSYTRQVISSFARQGTPVDMVSIGNEIRNGILWPVGEVNDPSNPADYDNLATDRAVLLPVLPRPDLGHAAERGRAGHPVPQEDRHRGDPVSVDAGQWQQPDRGQHRQLRLGAQPAVPGLPGRLSGLPG